MATTVTMKIMVLSKRHYTGKDLVRDRYGRMWELPRHLALAGHGVRGVSLSYRNAGEEAIDVEGHDDFQWHSFNVGMVVPAGLLRFWREINRVAMDFQPDLIWAGSDVFHIALGAYLAERRGVPFVADFYDNFESFGATRFLPGGRRLLHWAMGKSAAISCVSSTLAQKVAVGTKKKTKVEVIENAVDVKQFKPMDRTECRRYFRLPPDGYIVGTAGALFANRGIAVLGGACRLLQGRGTPVKLVVAGPRDVKFQPPRADEGVDLGILPHEDVPKLLNALNVVVVANLDSEFGRYCFPVKLYETLATSVPVAAARVGAAAEVLADTSQCLYEPGDEKDLASILQKQLTNPEMPNLPVPTWGELSAKLERLLQKTLAAS